MCILSQLALVTASLLHSLFPKLCNYISNSVQNVRNWKTMSTYRSFGVVRHKSFIFNCKSKTSSSQLRIFSCRHANATKTVLVFVYTVSVPVSFARPIMTRSPAVAEGPRCQLKSGKILHKLFDGLHLKRPTTGE